MTNFLKPLAHRGSTWVRQGQETLQNLVQQASAEALSRQASGVISKVAGSASAQDVYVAPKTKDSDWVQYLRDVVHLLSASVIVAFVADHWCERKLAANPDFPLCPKGHDDPPSSSGGSGGSQRMSFRARVDAGVSAGTANKYEVGTAWVVDAEKSLSAHPVSPYVVGGSVLSPVEVKVLGLRLTFTPAPVPMLRGPRLAL